MQAWHLFDLLEEVLAFVAIQVIPPTCLVSSSSIKWLTLTGRLLRGRQVYLNRPKQLLLLQFLWVLP